MLRKVQTGIFIALLIVLASCSSFQKILKSSDAEAKYESAIKYYEKGDYYRSMQLFEQLNIVFRGTSKAQKLNYYMAYCYYNQEDYILAAYYFKNYAKSFPTSDRAEECLYMSAYCHFKLSPKYSLDQTSTYEALNELQLFIDRYPKSDRVEKANNLIDELRAKLEKKAFEIAELYFKMGDYESTIVSCDNLLLEFPDTEYKEDVLYIVLRSYFSYAKMSIVKKQKERFSKAVESYEKLMYGYPDTDYYKDAISIHENSLQELNNFK
jgi:outer membrane protein assembly factor BamD